jgi:hypothetical protein
MLSPTVQCSGLFNLGHKRGFCATVVCWVQLKVRSGLGKIGHVFAQSLMISTASALIARKRADKPRGPRGYLLNLWFTIAKVCNMFGPKLNEGYFFVRLDSRGTPAS